MRPAPARPPARTLFIDPGVGETRAVVQLRGRPERLLIERDGARASTRLGARVAARVRRVEPALNLAFLDLGEGGEAVAEAARLVEGATLDVEITAEPRAGKAASVRIHAPLDGAGAEGAPRLLVPAPTLEQRLQGYARGPVTRGPDAREAADEAEEAALARVHPLPEGGSLAIEPTRALVAVDVDVGASGGGRGGADAKRAARAANLAALAEAARLLRLKGLGGLVVIDLAGRGHDGEALARAAREAFHPDQPGVNLGPISRFGAMELLRPWRERPVADRLCEADGRPSAATMALRLARALEREGRVQGGARLLARAAPEVAEAFSPWRPRLVERLGARFEVRATLDFARDRTEIAPL